jgi:transcriptional regulator with XRE-family HTH domain
MIQKCSIIVNREGISLGLLLQKLQMVAKMIQSGRQGEKMPKKPKIEPTSKIGIFLAEEAKKRGLSYRSFSLQVGLDEGTIAHIVSGRRGADVEVCVKLAEYLSLDPCYLLELAERIPPRPEEEQRPDWMRNVIYRLTTKNYSKQTIELIQTILDQSEQAS